MSLPDPPISVSLPPLPVSVFAVPVAPVSESLPAPAVTVWAALDTAIVNAPVMTLASTLVARTRGEATLAVPAVNVSVPEPLMAMAPAKALSAELEPLTVSARVSIAASMTKSSVPFAKAAKFDSATLAVSVEPVTRLLA